MQADTAAQCFQWLFTCSRADLDLGWIEHPSSIRVTISAGWGPTRKRRRSGGTGYARLSSFAVSAGSTSPSQWPHYDPAMPGSEPSRREQACVARNAGQEARLPLMCQCFTLIARAARRVGCKRQVAGGPPAGGKPETRESQRASYSCFDKEFGRGFGLHLEVRIRSCLQTCVCFCLRLAADNSFKAPSQTVNNQ
jgi:hypothetical protein